MFILRLFQRDHPSAELETRLHETGEITLGRDPNVDWPLGGRDESLSRRHCALKLDGGQLWLIDTSTNGTFLQTGERAPKERPVALGRRQTIHLGCLSLLIEEVRRLDEEIDVGEAGEASSGASASAVQTPHYRDAWLLEAFCDGAKIDASVLSAEDPADLMRRVGAIYRQTVLGLEALMVERARFKRDHELDRTTINASDNNPFKWTPARQLAEELLKVPPSVFLSGGDAIGACFKDIALHLDRLAEGAQSALAEALETLDPQAIEAEARAQGSLLQSRAAAFRTVHAKRYEALIGAAAQRRKTPLSWECDRAEAAALDVKPLFAAAYEKAAPTAEDLEDLEGPPKPRERLTSGR